ncbi:MAG: alpha,alpha-phosphotrehalase [Lachnospiraceae bacterium]|nr:alpha,alpha-phosphotrehalase [Lachnospiraceae bacterium]
MADFKSSTVYQIYTKSFQDSDGDGLGDIRGVIRRLDYLKELGIDYIWMTPFFPSPQRDNGYDVADYCGVDARYGTMEDVEALISEADQRGIGCMFDMVFNHTSTEHVWFQKALSGDPEYMDYYMFRDGDPDTPPTNWQSKFGGSAWEYVPSLKKWYLHLFDVTQADLNWENPKVREELKEVIRFWKNKGVKGFRFDVVNLISKPNIFENDLDGDGRRFYTDGPRVHQHLKELVRDTGIEDMVTVGEMSSTSLENCIRYTNPAEKELAMCFHFQHLKVDYRNGDKWELMAPDIEELKRLFIRWQEGMQEADGWDALFWCNHDQPRAVSRFGDDKRYWKESAKLLASCTHLMRGTPYVFQGEELGVTNAGFTDISQYRDVESINYFHILMEKGKSREEALEILGARSRDNGRTPMQWEEGAHAGFTSGEPWIGLPENFRTIHAEAEKKDPDSIYHYYRRLIALRKEYPVISEGRIAFLETETPGLLAYRRFTDTEELLVLNHLGREELAVPEALQKLLAETRSAGGWKHLIGNYESYDEGGRAEPGTVKSLRPFETAAYIRKTGNGKTD